MLGRMFFRQSMIDIVQLVDNQTKRSNSDLRVLGSMIFSMINNPIMVAMFSDDNLVGYHWCIILLTLSFSLFFYPLLFCCFLLINKMMILLGVCVFMFWCVIYNEKMREITLPTFNFFWTILIVLCTHFFVCLL